MQASIENHASVWTALTATSEGPGAIEGARVEALTRGSASPG